MLRYILIVCMMWAAGACAAFDIEIVDPVAIATNDASWDGKSVRIDGTTVVLDGAHELSALCLTNGATLTHSAGIVGMDLRVTGDCEIDATSQIDVSAQGYGGGAGPGAGVPQGSSGASGGGHGGRGGNTADGGQAYGLVAIPMQPGSGGGNTATCGVLGGAGGGVVHLQVDGVLRLDGAIQADGGPGVEGESFRNSGGGAGGSVWLNVTRLEGDGVIHADGGGTFRGDDFSGGGGGGRIALYARECDFPFEHIRAAKGAGSESAEEGTVHCSSNLPPPWVLSADLSGVVTTDIATVTLNFAQDIESSSFGLDDIITVGPTEVTPPTLMRHSARSFSLKYLPSLRVNGDYRIGIGPQIASTYGGIMDTDLDDVPGEVPDDVSWVDFTLAIPSPSISEVSPFGSFPNAVTSMTVCFDRPVDATTFTAADVALYGPQPMGSVAVSAVTDTVFTLSFDPPLSQEGVYELDLGPDIATCLGILMDEDDDGLTAEVPDDIFTQRFTIDRTPPASPVITNRLASPSVNLVTTAFPTVAGTKDSDATLWVDGAMMAEEGDTHWSCRTPIEMGMNTVEYVARDSAGNDSEPTSLIFFCDLLEPTVSITPADGAALTGQPLIEVVCADADSGPDITHSDLQVACGQESVAGTWAYDGASRARFIPAEALGDGAYAITVMARDRAGVVADPVVAAFTIATPPPTLEELMPAWWSEQGVFDGGQRGSNDFSAVNVGQLKWTACCAAEAFDETLPFGAGSAIRDLVDAFTNTENCCAVNIGQLKKIATPFYDWLGLALPWESAASTGEWAMANVGQLKSLFDLHLAADADADGLPDWWEVEHFGTNTVTDGSGDRDGDGLTEYEEYENRSLPDAVDTDMDSFSDGVEVLAGSDPADANVFPVDVSGSLAYQGTATGTAYVVAATDVDGWSGATCAVAALPANYVVSHAVRGRASWLKAFIDANGNGVCEVWEPVGVAPGAPQSYVQTTTGFDILLSGPDLDADGMEDVWEMTWFGSTDPLPDGDGDGDGATNIDEYRAGTDPLTSDADESAIPEGEQTVTGDAGLEVFSPME